MNPELPSVSSFRVEKPGKSKFAPSIGGRKSAAASSSSATSTANITTANTPTEETATQADLLEGVHDETDFLSTETQEPSENFAESSSATKPQGTRIESVASRRQVVKEVPSREASAPKLPEAPKNAASLTEAASATAGTETRRTMAYFLKDDGQGREMPANSKSVVPGSPGGTSSRRVVNLKNIKAPRSAATALAPQVRVVNDTIVFDEQMAAVATPASSDNFEQQLEYVDEDDVNGRHLTSATYAKRSGSNRWSQEETEFFYEALAMCGTDFSMIQTFFPHRTRAQVKGKFKIEEKAAPERIGQALRQRKTFDSTLKERIQVTTNKKSKQ